MTAEDYDAWYRTPRGAWIGEQEYVLLRKWLAMPPGASLLDVGSGTGYFSRRFAREGAVVTGLDADTEAVAYARTRTVGGDTYLVGDARKLPFADDRFDFCVAVTSLCFIEQQRAAISEMLRVASRRIALGLLNRHSLLYLTKGRAGGRGAYRGAHWHTQSDVTELLAGLPVVNVQFNSAIYLPTGTAFARTIERLITSRLLLGGFLAVVCDKR